MSEVKPMIENLLDNLCQLESEGLRLKGLRAKNAPRLISMRLKDNMPNQTISELNTDDKKTKYFGNPNDIHKSTKNFYEKLYSKRQPPKLHLLNFLARFLTERKS